MAKSSFLKHAAVYGLGNLLLSAAGFLLLPLYVQCLSSAEYGALEVLNALGDVAILVLLYNGLRQALLAFHNQAKDETERRAVVGTALFLTIVFLGAGGTLVACFAAPISRWFSFASAGVLQLAVVAVVLDALCLMLLTLAQAREEAMLFVVVSIGQLLVRVALCIVLVGVLGWGVEGVQVAVATASGLFAGVLLIREFARGGMRIDRQQLRAMFGFAAPLVPTGLGFYLLNTGDRLFLNHYIGLAAVGVYGLGYKLALAVKLFSRRPLYQVWSARMYEAARRPDAPVVFGQVFTRFLGAYLLVGLALCLVAEEIVSLLAGDSYGRYLDAASVIAPVVLAYCFLSAADLMDAAFFIHRRTRLKMVVMLAATVVVLLLYALLIPSFGVHGAALATMLGFLFHATLTWIVSQRVFFVQYEWGRVAVLLSSATGVWTIGRLLPSGWEMVPAKVALWTAWLVMLWLGGVVSAEEKRVSRDLGRAAVGWFRRGRRRTKDFTEPGQVAA